ncbi:DinB family protein [Agromyces humatus]|uniref:DinB-like domain-containing protein n=1 Tax=Agromyces humatus TaxID=279573 RepID=A0ABN2KZK9_9MICO|nr:DinB family protein [Agromyces humatus]
MSIEPFYGDWRLYNDLIVEGLRGMSPEELALRAVPDDAARADASASWPIWAIAGHAAATRVYWLCSFLGLPGRESTPFAGMEDDGWEDHLDQPRSAEELVAGWTTTWAIVAHALRSWTPETLDEPMSPDGEQAAAHLTRRSLIHRLMFHEAFHAGEIAVIQAIHGRPQIDLWPPGYHTVEAAKARAAER